MFALTIQEKGGEPKRMVFGKAEVTIGRVKGNDIILAKGNVSKEHARIVLKDGKFIVIDRKSTNGTFVNGRKITGPLVVKESDKIYIGDFLISVDDSSVGEEPVERPSSSPDLESEPAVPPRAPTLPPLAAAPPPRPSHVAPVPSFPPNVATSQAAVGPEPMAPPSVATMAAPPSLPQVAVAPPAPAVAAGVPAAGVQPSTVPPVVSPSGAAPVASAANGSGAPPVGPRRAPLSIPPPANGKSVRVSRPVRAVGRMGAVEPLEHRVLDQLDLQARIIDKIRRGLGDTIRPERVADAGLWQKAERTIKEVVATMDAAGEIPKALRETIAKDVLGEVLGLGALDELLADESVTDIVVDRRDRIIVRRNSKWSQSGRGFSSDVTMREILLRLAFSTGQLTVEHPLIEVRLRDGTRMSATLAPLSVSGASCSFRKPRRNPPSLDSLVKAGVLSPAMAGFLGASVAARRNLLVCGAPGAGTTTVLTALAEACPAGERVVTVEDIGEMTLSRDEWIALESWPGDQHGTPVTVAQLLGAALRLAPDRLVIGEVRGVEAVDLAHALSGPVDGALVAMAAPSANAALTRWQHLAGKETPGALIAQAVDLVVTVSAFADGVRVVAIDEISEGGETTAVFAWTGSGFHAAGHVPRFVHELAAAGISHDLAWFR